jgi:hypothetical protein
VFAVATALAVLAGVTSLLRGGHVRSAAAGAPREDSAGPQKRGAASPAPAESP